MCNKLPYCNPRIDKCLIEVIQEINEEKQVRTLASCCGHDKYTKTIVVRERDTRQISEYFSKIKLELKKRNRYYKKDNEGFYYIPEVREVEL